MNRLSTLKLISFCSIAAVIAMAPHALTGQTRNEEIAKRSLNSSNTNEVIVMGMIHGGHKEAGPFDLKNLKTLIRRINPDYVLTEVPPDRLSAAKEQFEKTGKISESRVRVFPEYTDALFPLTGEMNFEIIPCAAWNTNMNNSRRDTLKRLRTSHSVQFAEMENAQRLANENISALGDRHDPITIHSQQYDDFVKTGMEPYDRHFNEIIGDGGWSNINASHYGLISKALDQHRGKGKRFLITFGAWHKYYIKEQLTKRDDVKVIPMSRFLNTENTPGNWPRFRLNHSGTSSYGTTEIQTPQVQWKFQTGDVIESSAVISEGLVYVGGHAGCLHAVDQQSGELKWKFDVGGWVRATPSVVDGVVYFGADDNKFYAVDSQNGKLNWEFQLGEGGEQSSPTVEDDVVYFGAFDNNVYALNARNGKKIWEFDAGASMLSSPAVYNDTLFIGTYHGKLFSIDKQTGKQKWVFQENEKPIFSSPVANSQIVVFSSYDHHVYALNTADGSTRWKFRSGGEMFSSPTLAGSVIYVGSNDGYLYALDSTTGKPTWKTNLNGAVFSSPAVTDRSIYVGSSDGHLYALDRKSGGVRWKHLVAEGIKVWTSPIAIHGSIYFGSHFGELVALKEKEELKDELKEKETSQQQ